MLKTRHLAVIFIPALVLAGFVLFIRIIQFQSLNPNDETTKKSEDNPLTSVVPVFADDIVIGNRNTTNTLVLFGDFGCDNCRAEITMLAQLNVNYPNKFKMIWKGLPITRFPYSTETAHRYAYCASQQGKFLEYLDLIFSNLNDLSDANIIKLIATDVNFDLEKIDKCIASGKAKDYVDRNVAIGTSLGIQVVPTVFLNGTQIETPRISEEWLKVLNIK